MQIMTSSAVAAKLLGANNSQVGFQPQAKSTEPFLQASTRYVEATPELTGVYSDPRAQTATQSQASLAQRAVDAIQTTLATDVQDFKQEAKARLESAIGRSLGENETFTDLGSSTRSKLSKDVLDMNRSAFFADLTLNMATSQANEINLDKSYSLKLSEGMTTLDRAEGLQGLDMSKTEDRQKAVDYAISVQVGINTAGIQMAETNEVASDMMSKSLENAGVTDMDDLKDSYTELHRSRFENGEFTVIFDGVEITNDTL